MDEKSVVCANLATSQNNPSANNPSAIDTPLPAGHCKGIMGTPIKCNNGNGVASSFCGDDDSSAVTSAFMPIGSLCRDDRHWLFLSAQRGDQAITAHYPVSQRQAEGP
jgi:hypothetical protein